MRSIIGKIDDIINIIIYIYIKETLMYDLYRLRKAIINAVDCLIIENYSYPNTNVLIAGLIILDLEINKLKEDVNITIESRKEQEKKKRE